MIQPRLHAVVGAVEPFIKWYRTPPTDAIRRRCRSPSEVAGEEIGPRPISGRVPTIGDVVGVRKWYQSKENDEPDNMVPVSRQPRSTAPPGRATECRHGVAAVVLAYIDDDDGEIGARSETPIGAANGRTGSGTRSLGLSRREQSHGETIAIVAGDPTSPQFTLHSSLIGD